MTGPYNWTYSPVQLKLQARAIETTDIQIKLQAHAIETTGPYNWNYRPVQQKLQAHANETKGPCNWDYRPVQLKLQAIQLNYRPMQLKLEAHATETSGPCNWDYRPMKLKLQACTTETTGLYNWYYPYNRPVQANQSAVLVMHQTQMWTLHAWRIQQQAEVVDEVQRNRGQANECQHLQTSTKHQLCAWCLMGVVLHKQGRKAEISYLSQTSSRFPQDPFILPQIRAFFAYQHSKENSVSNRLSLTLPPRPGIPSSVRHRQVQLNVDSKILILTEIHQSVTKALPYAFVCFSLCKNDRCWILYTNRKIWSLTGHWRKHGSRKPFSEKVSNASVCTFICVLPQQTGLDTDSKPTHRKPSQVRLCQWSSVNYLFTGFLFPKVQSTQLVLEPSKVTTLQRHPWLHKSFLRLNNRGWNSDQYIQVLPNVVPIYKNEAESAFWNARIMKALYCSKQKFWGLHKLTFYPSYEALNLKSGQGHWNETEHKLQSSLILMFVQ